MELKKAVVFYCKICDYTCSKQSQWDRHIDTRKHKNVDKILTNVDILGPKKVHTCHCGKNYSHRQSLSIHKKKCNISENNEDSENSENSENIDKKDELINYLIKENKEFKNLILEIVKKDTTTNNNNNITTTNSHNKTFNLQFFLNETCKDAMNIMDFVDSIKLQLCDLENFEKVGYINGISSIIVKNLNLLDETKRPVHCTDTKREVMYVKDENKWEKEDETKKNIKKLIKHVTHKNTKLFKDFKEKYPGCEKSESKYSNTYDKLIVEAFGGKGDNYEEKEDKIIKNILKEIKIEKQ